MLAYVVALIVCAALALSVGLGVGLSGSSSASSTPPGLVIGTYRPTLRPSQVPTPPTTQNPTLTPTPVPTTPPTTLRPTTLQPTVQPTPSPSRIPTLSPTTLMPTSAPTPIVLYSDGVLRNGALGSRATTTALCASIASAQSLTCARPRMLISYAGDSIQDFPATYGFSDTWPVQNKTGAELAASWSDLANPTRSLHDVGVLSYGTLWWTGSNNIGAKRENCNGWTSALNGDNTGDVVNDYGKCGVSYAAINFYEDSVCGCDAQIAVVCACLPPV